MNIHSDVVKFDPKQLAKKLEENLPSACFCLLMGSAMDGEVAEGSDIDLAFYLDEAPSRDFYLKAFSVVESILPKVRSDVGVLNGADAVYRFEALKGRLLFSRDNERYAGFFSLTCREYESQMFDYKKQQRYRLEANNEL